MGTFLNIDLSGKTPTKFVWKHLLYSMIWILGILVVVFRVDVYAINSIKPEWHWIVGILPIVLITLTTITIFIQKWYYTLATLFYPLLALFWFIPKFILNKGKIYLFSHYVEYVFTRLKYFKSTIIHFTAFVVTVIILLVTENIYIKGLSMVTVSYFYFRFVFGYLKSSFKPAQMFGNDIEAYLVQYIEDEEHGNRLKLIESIIKESKEDEKLTEEERKKKQLKKLLMWNFGLSFVSKNLSGFKGKKAYVLSWVMQLGFFLLISILYFTFMNYQLFHISFTNFIVQESPNLFEFVYYTLKTITFSGIDNIKPNSEISKIIEIASFFVLGILILVILFSVIFSLRQDKIKENVELAIKICNTQNQQIINHIQVEFGTTVQSALKEFADIKKSVDNLRQIIDKLF